MHHYLYSDYHGERELVEIFSTKPSIQELQVAIREFAHDMGTQVFYVRSWNHTCEDGTVETWYDFGSWSTFLVYVEK